MLVNVTLLVQLVNFIAAYYLLRFFFFKPVSQVIHKEDEATHKQHTAINDHKTKIAQHVALKREEWQACQHYFREHRPELLTRPAITKSGAEIVVPELPQDQIKKVREEVTKLIISKVEHAS